MSCHACGHADVELALMRGDCLGGCEQRLKLNTPENLALFLGLVPDWPKLAEDLDLTNEHDLVTFRRRIDEAFNEALANLSERANERSDDHGDAR